MSRDEAEEYAATRTDPDLRTKEGRDEICRRFPGRDGTTHWNGCTLSHVICALHHALTIIEELQREKPR